MWRCPSRIVSNKSNLCASMKFSLSEGNVVLNHLDWQTLLSFPWWSQFCSRQWLPKFHQGQFHAVSSAELIVFPRISQGICSCLYVHLICWGSAGSWRCRCKSLPFSTNCSNPGNTQPEAPQGAHRGVASVPHVSPWEWQKTVQRVPRESHMLAYDGIPADPNPANCDDFLSGSQFH